MPIDDMNAHISLSPPLYPLGEKYNIDAMIMFFADDFESLTEYRKSIKRYILEQGAIQSFIHLEAIDFPGMISQIVNDVEYDGFRFMDKENNNLFTYETDNFGSGFFTHAIAISGWDDNRPVEVGGHTTTGAWLIKDSSGEVSYDDGYFWVAYDDPVISVFAMGLTACNEYDYEHQSKYQTHPGILSTIEAGGQYNENNCLDFGKQSYLFNGYATGTSWAVVSFPLQNNEDLAAVGLFCGNRNQKVSVNIYKDNLNTIPLHTQDFVIDEQGYHMLKLDNDVKFLANETMIIAVGFENESSHIRLPLCYVQDENYDFVYSSYFGKKDGDVFELTPYSEFDSNSAFFLQAVVRK